jgi:FkbM family methyltransferase
MYSQNNEEQIITDYFGKFVGTFLDIGANDGLNLSNTARLVELGWSGVMVEPVYGAWFECKARYKENKRIAVLHNAISDKVGVINFYECEDSLLSSTSETQVKSWNVPYNITTTDSITFDMLPKREYDFISIDAEGMDLIILKQIDLKDVKMICIEHGNSFEAEAKQYCEGFGMKLIHRNFENLIMGR